MQYTITLHPQVDSLDGRHLPALVALWLDDIASTASTLTHRSYVTQSAPVLRWWADRGQELQYTLDKRSLRDLPQWLATTPAPRTGRPLGWHAQNDALRRLRQVLRWGWDNGHIPVDLSTWVPAPNVDVDLPPVRRKARLDDLAALLRAARRGPTPERDIAMLAVLIGTGIRRAELRGLNIEDVTLDADQSGTLHVREAKRVEGAKLQGRVVAMDRWTGQYVNDWLNIRRQATGPLITTLGADRRTYTNRRISNVQITRRVAELADEADIGAVVQGPHDLRRHFASWFAVQHKGNPWAARLLSKQLGHARFAMTEHYILDDEEELRGVIRSPLASGRSLW